MHQQQTAFENIVGKGEIAHNEQFLLFQLNLMHRQQTAFENIVGKGEINFFFPTMSSTQSDNCIPICLCIFMTSYLYLLLNWKSLKLAYQQ